MEKEKGRKIGFRQDSASEERKAEEPEKPTRVGFGAVHPDQSVPRAPEEGKLRVPGIGRDLAYRENPVEERKEESGVWNDIPEMRKLKQETQEIIEGAYNEVSEFHKKFRDVAREYQEEEDEKVEGESESRGAEELDPSAARWMRHGSNTFQAFKWQARLAVRAFLADSKVPDEDLWGAVFGIRDETLSDYHALFGLMKASMFPKNEKEAVAAE